MTTSQFFLQNPLNKNQPPRSGKETLPTMYDLPSEDPEEPGLPDEFHDLQPQLLSLTFIPITCLLNMIFTGTDMNLYYDVNHLNWYKRPDWFAVLGVPRLYAGTDLRLSYVTWIEAVNPFVIVELVSPGTEKEDVGETQRQANEPPTKWQVYEEILQVPYYVVFNRYTNSLRAFVLQSGRYQELNLTQPRIWMDELGIGLGLWSGEYWGINRLWLRWYDADGNWIPTEAEAAEQKAAAAEQKAAAAEQKATTAEQQAVAVQKQLEIERNRAQLAQEQAEAAEKRAESLAQRLRELGIEP